MFDDRELHNVVIFGKSTTRSKTKENEALLFKRLKIQQFCKLWSDEEVGNAERIERSVKLADSGQKGRKSWTIWSQAKWNELER